MVQSVANCELDLGGSRRSGDAGIAYRPPDRTNGTLCSRRTWGNPPGRPRFSDVRFVVLFAALFLAASDCLAQYAMSVTRTGTRDTLLYVHENGFVGIGTTRPAMLYFPYKGSPYLRQNGLARFSVIHNRANAPDGNYAGVSALVTGNTANTVNLVGLQGIAAGTNDTTVGVHGRAGGVGTVPSIGGFFEANGAGVGINIAGYFSSRGLGPNYGLWADADWTPAVLNRLQDDGALLSFRVRERERAWVSAHGEFVSYNNFTSSLMTVSEEDLEPSAVVVTTGNAVIDTMNGASVRALAVSQSRFANDPAVVGAYLARMRTQDSQEPGQHSLVMNGGRGRVWVVDTGRDLQPGDALITSHIAGHAMRDPGVFDLGHIFAFVLSPIVWTDAHDEVKGHRRALADVLFHKTIANHKAQRLEHEVEFLANRVARLESLVEWLQLPDDAFDNDVDDEIPPDIVPDRPPHD